MIRWRALRHYAGTVFAQGAILSLGVVSGILSARLLGPSGRGILAAVTIWPLALVFLTSCGLNQAIVYQLSKCRYSYAQISGSVLTIAAAQTVIVILVGRLVLPLVLHRYPQEVLRLGFWFLAFTPILMLSGYPANVLQALHYSRAFNVVRTVAAATYGLGLVVLVAIGANSVGKVVGVQLAGYVIALFIGVALLFGKSKVKPEASRAAIRDLVSYGTRAQATNLTTYFNQRCDQLVLSVLVPPRELGLYAVAVTLAMAVTFVPQAVGLVTFADGASQATDSARRTVATSFRMSLAWLIVVCALLFVAAPFLFQITFGADFAGASLACRILLPGMVAAGLNQVLYAGANAMGQPALPSFAELAGLVFTVIGLAALVPKYGYIAAAAISTVAYVTSFLVMLWLSARHLGLHVSALLLPEVATVVSQLERSVL